MNEFNAGEPVQHEPATQAQRISKLGFRNRFTQAEKVAIELAALDEPGAAMPERQKAAAVRAYQADMAAAIYIDLTRPELRAGVQSLEALGLLASGRAAEIIDAPITESEIYKES